MSIVNSLPEDIKIETSANALITACRSAGISEAMTLAILNGLVRKAADPATREKNFGDKLDQALERRYGLKPESNPQ